MALHRSRPWGRVFKAFGHVAWHKREEAFLNTLVAFNGFNGTVLWKRDIPAGLMVHRNTMIATEDTLFFGDDKSCKIIDAATGELRSEIIVPPYITGGTFWKWMALEEGVLYALIGQGEQRDETMRYNREAHGWPWARISTGYNQADHPWGFGRTLLAINPETKRILWHYHEDEPIDSRAVCMKNGKIFVFRFGAYLTCIESQTGRTLWRKIEENAPAHFPSLGEEIWTNSVRSVVAPGDLHYDGIVNFLDFSVLAGYWLENAPAVDISPPGGDDIVNSMDLAVIAQEWLAEANL